MFDIKLIDEARNWWKLYSVQIMLVLTFLAGLEGVWGTVSWLVPAGLRPYAVALFALAGIVARLIDQSKVVTEGELKKANALAAKTGELAAQVDEAQTSTEAAELAKKRDIAKAEFDRLVLLINSKESGQARVDDAKSA